MSRERRQRHCENPGLDSEVIKGVLSPHNGARALRSRACTLVEYFSVVRQDDNSTSQTCYAVKDGLNISECTLRISAMICGIPF